MLFYSSAFSTLYYRIQYSCGFDSSFAYLFRSMLSPITVSIANKLSRDWRFSSIVGSASVTRVFRKGTRYPEWLIMMHYAAHLFAPCDAARLRKMLLLVLSVALDFVQVSATHGGVFVFEDTQPKPIYSYCRLGPDNDVLEVKEKVKISNWANSAAIVVSQFIKSTIWIYRLVSTLLAKWI